MKLHLTSDPLDQNGDLGTSGSADFLTSAFGLLAGQSNVTSAVSAAPSPASTPLAPVLPDESVEAMAAVSSSGSGGLGSVVAETSSSGFTINLVFDAAAMAAPASFRAGIEQAASILSATITNKITVNIDIDYSGTGGGAFAGPTTGEFVNYSTVRADLVANAAPGDTSFNALPTGSTIQGQSEVAVWNAQLKLFGLLSPTNSAADGSASFATDINSNLLVGVALHELTHAIGRVPYGEPDGPEPDIFDFYRFTSSGTRLFTDNIPASSAYFSLDGGNTKLADFGVSSDPSDFLNSGVQGGNDPFNEFYSGSTLQSLTTVDLKMLDALGFNTIGIIVPFNTAEALQGGAAVSLLSGTPNINDPASTTLSSATIKIANAGGSAVAGDELFVNVNGSLIQNGSLGSGVTASWNATTDTLRLSGTASIATYDTLLSEIAFRDTGTDTSTGSHPVRTVTWSINDGTNSYNTASTIDTDRAPVAANNTATDAVGTTLSTSAASGVLANDTDLDGDSLTVTGVGTARGTGTVGSALAGTYGHLTLNANGSYSYVADNTSAINNAPTGSHLQDTFGYTVSDGNGGTANASLTITLDRAPVVTVANVTLSAGHTTVAASSLFSATDPDGNTIATYAFEDTSSGHFVLNGVVEPNNQEIDLTAAQLSLVTYQGVAGAAADTVEVRVNDGTLWSNWTSFTVTPPALVIQTDGTTALTEAGNNYYLDNTSTGTGPEVKQGGVAVTAGSDTIIGAVQVAGGGYDVAWKTTGADQYTVWSLDSNGNFIGNIAGGAVTGESATLEHFETIFGQDLNGDGHIGPPPPPPPTTISIDGNTTLVQSGNDYFLDVTGGSTLGPEVKQGGVAVTAGSDTIIGAVQVAGGGYDVAWKTTGADQYTVWSLDSNGNFIGNIAGGAVTGESATLENFETIFGQDLNGDGHIGPPPPPPPTTISIDGNTTLVQSGNDYFLDVTGGSTLGPEVKQGGVAVTAGSDTIIGAVQVAGGGYDVAWKTTGADQYTVWSLDSNGNFIGNIAGGAVTGESATLENFETIFGQDLNGDGHIGPPPPPPPTTISIDGNTTLVQSGNDYFLDVTGGSTLGPEVKQGGVAVTAGSDTIIGAVQVAGGGYDVAWKTTGADQYTVWSLDSNGNFIGNIAGGAVTGESATLEHFETIFGQDLNGDGHIGPPPPPPPTTISIDGNTTLVQSGNDYFLDVTGGSTLGPEVKQGGVAVTAGSDTIIGAVQVAGGGYDVAWKTTGADQYTVWSLDSNGNFIGNIAGGAVTGESATLEHFETIFGQDLNGDGHIGPPAGGSVTANLQSAASSSANNFRFISHDFHFSNNGNDAAGQTPASSTGQGSATAMAGRDSFVFASSHGPASTASSTSWADATPPNGATFANIHAAPTGTHEEAFGASVIPDTMHAAQWLAHHGGFHFV